MADKCRYCKTELYVYPQVKLCPRCQAAEIDKLAKEYGDKYQAYKKL